MPEYLAIRRPLINDPAGLRRPSWQCTYGEDNEWMMTLLKSRCVRGCACSCVCVRACPCLSVALRVCFTPVIPNEKQMKHLGCCMMEWVSWTRSRNNCGGGRAHGEDVSFQFQSWLTFAFTLSARGFFFFFSCLEFTARFNPLITLNFRLTIGTNRRLYLHHCLFLKSNGTNVPKFGKRLESAISAFSHYRIIFLGPKS